MELVIGIVSGVLTSVIVGIAVYLFRKNWNPVVWTLVREDDERWRLTRVSSRRALDVFMKRPAYLEGPTYPGPYIVGQSAMSDLEGGSSTTFILRGVETNWALRWIERDRRKSAAVNLPPRIDRVEIRRREFTIVTNPYE